MGQLELTSRAEADAVIDQSHTPDKQTKALEATFEWQHNLQHLAAHSGSIGSQSAAEIKIVQTSKQTAFSLPLVHIITKSRVEG